VSCFIKLDVRQCLPCGNCLLCARPVRREQAQTNSVGGRLYIGMHCALRHALAAAGRTGLSCALSMATPCSWMQARSKVSSLGLSVPHTSCSQVSSFKGAPSSTPAEARPFRGARHTCSAASNTRSLSARKEYDGVEPRAR